MQDLGAAVTTPSTYRYGKLALAFALALFASADCAYWERCTPQPRAIFSGITYSWRPRLPGDLAKGVETVVSDHVTSHLWEHTYLLWFDDNLNAHLRPSKPPKPEELREAKWGIGGQGVGLQGGDMVWRRPKARFTNGYRN